MGVSKVVLIDPNTQTPEVLMDVTGDDTSAGVLLAGNVGTRNDGEKVTGNIPTRTSSDLSVSGAIVNTPSGYYPTSVAAAVASGTAGTPTATKGSVSNHSVSVTPSVTNQTGYITGSTKTGTPVSVSASELVSGTKSISANGTGIDVTNYASVDVDVPATPLQTKSVTPTENAQTVTPDTGYALSQVNVGAIDSEYVGSDITRRSSSDLTFAENRTTGTPTVTAPAGYYDEDASKVLSMGSISNPAITKGTVSNNTMPLTASITMTAGYIYPGSKTTSGYYVSASELVSGTKTISENGTGIDVTNYKYIDVSVAPSPSAITTGLTNALEFRSPSSFTFKSQNGKTWNGILEWTDGVQSWSVWDGTTTLTASDGVLYLRGTGNTHITGSSSYNRGFVTTGRSISCNGNIETLLDYQMVALGDHPVMDSYCFFHLFYYDDNIISAPALPATTLSSHCYAYMFGTTGITTAPALPATTLADSCYYGMFSYCYGLASAPSVLPATTLDQFCYTSMFRACWALTTAPALPATTLTLSCYTSMFRDCRGLTSVPTLSATALANSCYDEMFYGCTSLTTVPALPATILKDWCYRSMFYGCTSLTSVPALPATGMRYYCYSKMFYGCTSLKVSATYDATNYPYTLRIPKTGTGSAGTSLLDDMFTNTGGSFTGTPSLDTDYYTENPLVEATA